MKDLFVWQTKKETINNYDMICAWPSLETLELNKQLHAMMSQCLSVGVISTMYILFISIKS